MLTLYVPAESLNNEKELLKQVAKGDANAFRQLFEQYKDKLYSYAMHYTAREDVSEELVQEVFMKVWLYREKLVEIERFEAWVFTICRNLSFNYLRKIAHEEAMLQRAPGHNNTAPETADSLLLYKEQTVLLQSAIDRLPPQQKLIYTLNREQHLKTEEIAQQLGLAHGTVKSHLALALRSIRTYIQAFIDSGLLLLLFIR